MTDTGVDGQRMAHPWLVSWGTAFVVALLGVGLAPIEGETFGFTWGSHFGTLLIPTALLGLFLSRRTWPWWVAVLTALVACSVVLAGVAFVRAASSGPTLAAPARVGDWRKQYDQAALDAIADAAARIDRLPAGYVDGEP